MRSYADACGITRALDLIGERWAIPVVRELVFGPRRYSDLAGALPGVSTNILGARLKELTEAGVIEKRRLGPPAAVTVYELTAWGRALEPILISLGRWAAHTSVDLETQAFSASSFALSLKTTFDDAAANNVKMQLRFQMGEEVFDAHVDETFAIWRVVDPAGTTPAPAEQVDGRAARLTAEPKALAALIYQRLDPAAASRDGLVQIDGSMDAVRAFTRRFALPSPPAETTPIAGHVADRGTRTSP